MKVIQIVPRLPPAVDGVGDYALSLARDLRAHHNIQTEFLVCDPHWSGPERVSDFCIYKLQRQDAKSFKDCFEYILDLKKPQVLILQYVSYGYDKHGGPVWLVDALTAAKETNPRLALITMFHEVAASSWKPWTRTFWNQLRQLKIAREIFKLSQMTLTSSDFQKRKIERMSPVQKNIICLPVPSNVGEADCPPSWGGRENAAVIFGNNKLQIKKNFSNIIKMARKLKIQTVYDVGRPTEGALQYDQNISVKTMGFLKPQEISNLLLRVRFGFLESSTRMFAKSGVFAAYCAHGVIAISCRKFNGAEDGLKKGRDFICCDFEKNMEEDVFESISSAAYSWYSQHRLDKQVLTWVKLIEKASP